MKAGTKPAPVASLDEARLLQGMAALATARRRVVEIEALLRADCARWSAANGYCVVLTPEQVAREIAAREGRENG
ncbi:MAG: hypothetical protein QOH47_2365 [Sphingomonadales bacterium]|jgi:hypothetical protein|nr:hypothetical protein [Sphingomonadales bacterium]